MSASLRVCASDPSGSLDPQCWNRETPTAFDAVATAGGGTTTGIDFCLNACAPRSWYLDSDQDGYGNPSASTSACSAPSGYTADDSDCDDSEPEIHPGASELCNNMDDDCNGTVDGFETACGSGLCQRNGACTAGSDSCVPGDSSAEICDGLDNSCNDQIDEGNPGGGAPCATGQRGVCAPGTVTCAGGSLQCVRIVNPLPEACDNLDNDCDGTVDGFETACGTGACHSAGSCASGSDSCVPGPSSPESCDGVDNDCNGQPDEGNPGGGVACESGMPGLCAAGTTLCQDGLLECAQNGQPRSEVCNLLDDDCDGTVDDMAAGACTLFLTDPLDGAVLDCRPGAPPPTLTWNQAQYDKFRVLVSWVPTFLSTKRVTSGDALLRITAWTVPVRKWEKLCAHVGQSLYIQVLGVDVEVPLGAAGRKFTSPSATVGVQK